MRLRRWATSGRRVGVIGDILSLFLARFLSIKCLVVLAVS